MVQYNMDKENCLIYEGVFFRIEWFYDKAGYSQAFEYFRKASPYQKRKFLMLVKKIGDFGKIFDKTNSDMKEMKFMHLNLSLIDIYVFLRKERK